MLPSRRDIAAIYQRNVDAVYRLSYSYLKTAADAEDVTQSVFLKLVDCGKRFESAEHERAWLLACAANRCKDILKSGYRTRTVELPAELADAQADPRADASQERETLEAILALPDRHKDCVFMHYYEGYSTDEIARITGRNPSTVRSHLSEARAMLRRMLGGESNG